MDEPSKRQAGDRLKREDGEGSPTSVTNNIKELEKFFDRQLVQLEGSGWKTTEFGAEVVVQARALVDRHEALCRLRDSEFVVAFLPQHAYFVSRLLRTFKDKQPDIKIIKHPMGEQDRARHVYDAHLLGPLAQGALDLVIGPPPHGHMELVPTRLYTSQLEAMVPVEEERDAFEVHDLAQRPLLVPPITTRSRLLLEETFRDHVLDDPGAAVRVELEAYGTKPLHDFGVDGHGIVVVPSDIAHQFKAGNRLGGTDAARFKWIPVCLNGTPLTHDVFAITRKEPHDVIKEIVTTLVEQTKYLDVTPLTSQKSPT